MTDDLDIITNITPSPRGLRITLRGEINLHRAPALREQLLPLIQQERGNLLIDMTEVPHMDSSGLATLIEALRIVRNSGGRIILHDLPHRVRGLFEIAQLHKTFVIVQNLEEALDQP